MGPELRKPPPFISKWGPAKLKMMSAQLSAIEAQLIPGGLASKIAMVGGWQFPLTISGGGGQHI